MTNTTPSSAVRTDLRDPDVERLEGRLHDPRRVLGLRPLSPAT
jgi:hypothetical protein